MKIYQVNYLAFDRAYDITEYYLKESNAKAQSETKHDDDLITYNKRIREVETND